MVLLLYRLLRRARRWRSIWRCRNLRNGIDRQHGAEADHDGTPEGMLYARHAFVSYRVESNQKSFHSQRLHVQSTHFLSFDSRDLVAVAKYLVIGKF